MSESITPSCRILFIKLIVLSFLFVLISSNSTQASQSTTEDIQVYQNNAHLSPEHKQKLADDISRYRNADNLWDVLRNEFSLPHYEDTPAVQQKIEWYMNNQDFLLRSASRAAPYLYYILQQVKKRHLPAELVLLPIVESGYNPFSRSSVGATGIWQLMPSTASGLGVKQDWWYDGRRDVIASTRAALNYLDYLRTFFDGNWLLAIAAYNTGEGNVQAAIKRNIREGRDTDFWSIPVAQQTKDYVPSFLALATIISRPDLYPIYFPTVRNAPYLAQVDIGTQIHLKRAASLAGISYQKLIQLNPGFNRATTSNQAPYKLVLPIENVEQFTESFANSPLNNAVNWLHYRVKSGDTIFTIAKKFDTNINELRKMNHLSKNNLLRPGTNLLLPNKEKTIDDDFSAEETVNETPKISDRVIVAKKDKGSDEIVSISVPTNQVQKYTLQPGDTIYMVRANDTLDKIANRFHTNSYNIRMANKISTNKLQPGSQLIIPTHATTLAKNVTSSGDKLFPGDTVYMVRRGDTVEKIARKFRTKASAIRIINLVDNNSLNEGQKLIIPTHISG